MGVLPGTSYNSFTTLRVKARRPSPWSQLPRAEETASGC
jgi:hypothetical protein